MEVEQLFDPRNVDLNALYQQDIDLGVDWLSFEPVKNIKEVQIEEEKTYDLENFIVDGETGEYLPIPQSKQPQPTQTENVAQNVQNNTEVFNIDECLDFLQTSISSQSNENVQPMSETTVIGSLTCLIDPQENVNNTETVNHGLWDDIATLSELTGIAFSADEEERSPQAPDISPQVKNLKPLYHDMNQYRSNTQIQQQIPEQLQQQTQLIPAGPSDQFFNQRFNYPTPPYEDQETQSPPNYTQPSAVSFPSENEIYRNNDFDESDLLMAQQDTLLAQLDNSHITNSNSPPAISPNGLPLPGQWFLGREEPSDDFEQVLSELSILNNMQPQNGAYLNPTSAPYVPPPSNDINVTQTPQVHVMAETYESDSGISVESSSYGVVGQRVPAYMEIDVFETEPAASHKAKVKKLVNHNHVYAGKNYENVEEDTEERKITQRESRDLRKARELGLPFTLEQIIHTPVEEYNEILAQSTLTPAQQSLVRDIRRRGKNKVAAQNCRKRKIETISSMEIDIDELIMKKDSLVNKQKEIEMTRGNLKKKYSQLYQQIFRSLRDDTGRPYDPSHYSLEQVEGAVILVPKANNNSSRSNGVLVANGNDECMETNQVSFFDLSKVKVEQAD